jgi:hypothetical protein
VDLEFFVYFQYSCLSDMPFVACLFILCSTIFFRLEKLI